MARKYVVERTFSTKRAANYYADSERVKGDRQRVTDPKDVTLRYRVLDGGKRKNKYKRKHYAKRRKQKFTTGKVRSSSIGTRRSRL